MTDKLLEERIQKLEAQVAALHRANAGITVAAGLNRLGQRTIIDGDLDLHEHKVVNGKIDPIDNLTSTGQAAGRYPAADGAGGVIWQDAILPSVYFLHSENADVAGYKTLDDTPTDDPETFDWVGVINGVGWVDIQEFVTAPGGLGTTLLAAGVYEFHFWSKVDNTAGTTTLRAQLYKRSGTVNTLFATATATDFTGTSIVEQIFSVAVTDQVFLPTDRLVLIISVSTTSGALITVNLYYEGTTYYSHFHTPGMAGSPADHGGLIGLADDDHSQYLNNTRHDTTARHGSTVVDHGSIGGLADDDHTQYLLASGARIATAINSQGEIRAEVNEDTQVTVGQGRIEIGKDGRVGAATPFIDFHSSANSPDYDVRLIASGGNATPGQGVLDVYAAAAFRLHGWHILSGDHGFAAVIDGGGAAPTVGWKHYIPMPYRGYLHYYDCAADVVGSCAIGIYSFSSFPTVYGLIASVTLASQQTTSGAFATPTTFNAGSIVGIYVVSASTLTRVTITVRLVKN